MWSMFKKAKEVVVPNKILAVISDIKIGDKFALKNDDSPWANAERPIVTVLDIKEGWVRYRIGHIFPDERKPIDVFLGMYNKL